MPESSHGREELRRCIEECGCQHARLTCEQLVEIMQELVETRTSVEQLKLLFNSAKSSVDGTIDLLEFVDFLYDGHTQDATVAEPSQPENMHSAERLPQCRWTVSNEQLLLGSCIA
eukprot:TRINITY_DN12663_c0_g1_i2.p2 TRINITY_DN12663_c0_g1~~TRINITY_DN12663_c0_g1_i2.p2  ORF type:complete len:116 (+),score=23.03 TRINITY_DN12663_c0_g1_i2:16-363(+)